MRRFLDWFNESRGTALDGILRAGVAHVWFESIHPFEDGNGRVGRAIIDLALAQYARKPAHLHGFSIELRRRQAEYYQALNGAQRGNGEVTAWLEWFVVAFAGACRATSAMLEESLARGRFWTTHKLTTVTARQRKVVDKMLEAGPGKFEGGLTLRKYLRLTGVSRATAWRDIDNLVDQKLLTPGAGTGRARYYDIAIPGWGWAPPGPSPTLVPPPA